MSDTYLYCSHNYLTTFFARLMNKHERLSSLKHEAQLSVLGLTK